MLSFAILISSIMTHLIRAHLKKNNSTIVLLVSSFAAAYGAFVPPLLALFGMADDAPGLVLLGLFIGVFLPVGLWNLHRLKKEYS
jgi:hypothetical protein